jgi:hypothetical protein
MLTLVALGAFHGLNPAMGWLFAVALGLQDRRRATVLRAIPPIALGHLASVGTVVAIVGVARVFVDPVIVRVAGAVALIGFGLYKLRVARAHPRWVGMRVGFVDLTLWSFLMSSAHGAGLMLIPVLTPRAPALAMHASAAHAHVLASAALASGAAALAVHTLAFLGVTVVLALLVYEVFGLGLLRVAWVNLDVLWAGALVVAGLVTLVT